MRLHVFKHGRLWFALIVSPGAGWEPAAVFLSWESALHAGYDKLEEERQKREQLEKDMRVLRREFAT